jgi:hypothetical protein
MASRELAYDFFVDWAGDDSFSFDETSYVSSAMGNEEMANPEESVSAGSGFASEMTVTLFNPGRRFSPSASPLLASGGIREHIQNGKFYGKRVRFKVAIDGDSELLFQGRIKSITENARTVGSFGTVTLKCASDDAFLINRKLNTPASDTKTFYDTGKDEGELIARTLTLAGLSDGTDFVSQANGNVNKTIDRGLFTIPWYWLESDSPIEDCWKLASACGGRFYFNTTDGKYYYKNAQFLGFPPASVSQEAISESNCDAVGPVYTDKELYKTVKVTAKAREIGDSKVLWEPEEVIRILPGETVVFNAKLSVPIYQFVELKVVATNTGGFLISDDIVVNSATYFTQNVSFSLTNTGQYHAFLRTFQLIGRAIEGGQSIVYDSPSLDTAYWSGRQGKERKVADNPYIQTLAQAEAIADILAHRQGYYNEEFEVDGYRGTKLLRVGWRVTLLNDSLAINKEAIITSLSWRADSTGFTQDFKALAGNNLYHYTPDSYFKIGTHSANSSKRLFY